MIYSTLISDSNNRTGPLLDFSSLVGWQFGSAGGIDWSAQGFTPATFFAAGTTAEFRLEDNAISLGTTFRTDLAHYSHSCQSVHFAHCSLTPHSAAQFNSFNPVSVFSIRKSGFGGVLPDITKTVGLMTSVDLSFNRVRRPV